MERKFFTYTLLLAGLCGVNGVSEVSAQSKTAARPRLIVQLVVGSMRAEDIDRYMDRFGEGGIRRLVDGGARYTDCRYDCQQTTTPVSLATLTTGALPSTHGIIGTRWMDYTANRPVALLGADETQPSPEHLIAPTFGETLLQQAAGSQTVTIAAEPTSAVVMNGRGGVAYWLDEAGDWASSTAYVEALPEWIERSNREHYNRSYVETEWRSLLGSDQYRNTRHWDIAFAGKSRRSKEEQSPNRLKLTGDRERLLYTPAGNTALLGFAKQAIAQYRLGTDATPDLLNICLDPSRCIAEAYGPESVEVEDMYYRLDRDLEDFLTFLFAQVKNGEVLVILTSDHGTSPSCDYGPRPADRFNNRQFAVIVNGFLNVRYGTGDWVLACEDKHLWLNHNLIYERGLNLSEVQNEVAIFAMQFSGVSHALTSTAMRTSYFGSGYARKMQNGFYPRRSGDVVLNLVPGCIEERDRCVSSSGSLYGYDTQVPLILYGTGIGAQRIGRPVEMTAVAPTLSRLIGITEPAASEGEILHEIVDL